MPNIEVIATDGSIQKRIIWIGITPDGISCDIPYKGLQRHVTLHKDGSFWSTYEGKKEKHYQIQPLDQLKIRFRLATFNFVPDISQLTTEDYKMKKLDSIIFVDTRAYQSNHKANNIGNNISDNKPPYITCNIDLIEPRNYELLGGIERFGGEIHVYTQFKLGPWIVISIY